MLIVTFCGHGDILYSDNTKEELYTQIENLIIQGADKFLLGGYGNFDLLAAHTVKDLKNKYPHINSSLVIPYINRSYNQSFYDETVYPPLENVPLRYAISKRNQWMIENCDILICYVYHSWGGAYTTYSYAKKKNKTIINLSVEELLLKRQHHY